MATEQDRQTTPGSVVDQMQGDLTLAMRARDKVQVRALRTALAAIANAEAPAVDLEAGAGTPPTAPEVGRLVEHQRLVLSADDIDAVLSAEIDDRHDTIAQLAPHRRDTEIAELRTEIEVLEQYRS